MSGQEDTDSVAFLPWLKKKKPVAAAPPAANAVLQTDTVQTIAYVSATARAIRNGSQHGSATAAGPPETTGQRKQGAAAGQGASKQREPLPSPAPAQPRAEVLKKAQLLTTLQHYTDLGEDVPADMRNKLAQKAQQVQRQAAMQPAARRPAAPDASAAKAASAAPRHTPGNANGQAVAKGSSIGGHRHPAAAPERHKEQRPLNGSGAQQVKEGSSSTTVHLSTSGRQTQRPMHPSATQRPTPHNHQPASSLPRGSSIPGPATASAGGGTSQMARPGVRPSAVPPKLNGAIQGQQARGTLLDRRVQERIPHGSKPAASGAGSNKMMSFTERAELLKRQRQAQRRPAEDLESEYDEEEDDDFVVDEADGGDDWRRELMKVTRYDPTRYNDRFFDDRQMEVGYRQMIAEENRSARLGRSEDEKAEAEERRRAAEKAARKKKAKLGH